MIDLPSGEDEDVAESSSKQFIWIKILISIFVGVSLSSALAGTITTGGNDSLEFGRRIYNVGSCAQDSVQVNPRLEGVEPNLLTQLTVSGISPYLCDNRIVILSPFDSNGDPLPIVEIYISGNEFRAGPNLAISDTSTVLLRQISSDSYSIKVSTLESGTATIHVLSGGSGKLLRSLESALEGLAISFQVQFQPPIQVVGYGRTDIQICLLDSSC